jgi:two-component system response regulator MprA
MRALMKRAGVTQETAYAGLRLDPTTHEIAADAGSVSLTPTEFRLIAALADNGDAITSRRELIRAAWPEGAVVHDNTLDVYVARLRRKLAELPDAPEIATAHGVGYRLQ